MERFVEVDKNNLEKYLQNYKVVCCKLKNSRIKAKQLAIFEIIMLMFDLEVIYIKNPPLGDVKGIIAFFVPVKKFDKTVNRLKFIGYCNEFFVLSFEEPFGVNKTNLLTINKLMWKTFKYSLFDLYVQDEELYKAQSPHKREFKIIGYDGEVKSLEGYRGDGTELGRRALPTEDARCMVNLSTPFQNKNVLDCFAGGGSIAFMQRFINPNVKMFTADIDGKLKPGLEFYGSTHFVGDASVLKFEQSFNSIITEVPFSKNITKTVNKCFDNLQNNVSENLIVMCDSKQSLEINENLSRNFHMLINKDLNRKGTDVCISVWTKNEELVSELLSFLEVLKNIY
ncbi:MAG: hypothetical protein R3Y35_05405 [Clostridia bacterium]